MHSMPFLYMYQELPSDNPQLNSVGVASAESQAFLRIVRFDSTCASLLLNLNLRGACLGLAATLLDLAGGLN